ncbi:YolD-like family protein [Paenibacillus sp. D2_2]|uniref:YolD-like family protein n=1 Tax=Paenibacillus sp. D2_2 TaxID=3073092 RepID=UPI0028166301|nr:YolD-like family protein [Paenibacillus sp. D2_2]WMT39734.1 YolD-like family protein [Paenibacillus sp. D2_2]
MEMIDMSDLLNGGLWDRSFILPEHKKAMERQDRESKRVTKPILDAQELEQIQQALSETFHQHRRITLKLFDEFENVEVSGFVTAIQSYRREIKLAIAQGDYQWIRMTDILSAE